MLLIPGASARFVCLPLVLPALLSLSLVSCGSRSTLRSGDGDDSVDVPEFCETDAECESACMERECRAGQCVDVRPFSCDDGDPCTTDACDAELGCVHTSVTPDLDGDGHHAPLPGFLPGEPGSCGDDCDDTSALARPGGSELCDGVDNDCDGVVDNGAKYLVRRTEPVRVASRGLARASGAGLAFGDGVFALGYGAGQRQWRSYLRGLDVRGRSVFPETQLTEVNVSSFGSVLEWSGNAFAAVWPDARQSGNYEVYFARFDAAGRKLGPDLRVTNASGFSVRPDMLYDQGRFLLTWDDRRTATNTDEALVFAQIVDAEGRLVGKNEELTPRGLVAESPDIAASERRLGVAFTLLEPMGGVYLGFRTFDKQFGSPSPLVELGNGDVQSPHVVALRDRFIVSWHTNDGGAYGPSIMAAVLGDSGEVLVPPEPVTFDTQSARSHATLSFGDRVVMVWGQFDQGSYDLYAQVLGPRFQLYEPPTQLTFDATDELSPYLALSEDGTLGVLYDSYGDERQAYFTSFGCAQPIIK